MSLPQPKKMRLTDRWLAKYTAWMQAIPEFSFRRRWFILAFFAVFTAGMSFGLKNLKSNT